MASITGITAERAEEIWNASVTSGTISAEGKLLLKTRGGTVLDAGSVAIPFVNKVYPVGSIFMSTSNVNPATSLGAGTWVAWGSGRVPVGFDGSQTEFDTSEETGGAKTVTLVGNNLPASIPVTKTNAADTGSTPGADSGAGSVAAGTNSGRYNSTVSNSGGGQPINNLQPYIVCYMWKRTA